MHEKKNWVKIEKLNLFLPYSQHEHKEGQRVGTKDFWETQMMDQACPLRYPHLYLKHCSG